MKSLVEYLNEQKECKNCDKQSYETKTFSFDLKEFEGSKEALESFESAATENIDYSNEDGKISFTITKENYTEATGFLTAVKDYIKKLGANTTKRSSDTKYADKVHKMEDKVKELDDLIASYSTAEKTKENTADPNKNENE